ncbi:MAG: asparagine synthase-related protein [Candidatus Aminicenantales bacterium]
MGGWAAVIGQAQDAKQRLCRFRKVFSVSGVPSLRVKMLASNPDITAFSWGWTKAEVSDIQSAESEGTLLILCGVVTDLGRFGPVLPSQSQTAAQILKLWKRYPEKLIPELNGSFNLLFYEKNSGMTVLYTDRFASRSVWIYKEAECLIAGNFPSAVAALCRTSLEIDPAGLWSLFHTSRHPETRGLYHGVRSLSAGQKAVFAPDSEAEISFWWRRKYRPEHGLSPSEWGEILARALLKAAERYKKVSPNPHLFLSGGLDSRIVAAAYRKPLKTITLCTEPNTESRVAAKVAKSLGLEHRTVIRSPYWYLKTKEASALISSGNHLSSHTHFIVPVIETVSRTPDACFFLGDLLENLNHHYFRFPKSNNFYFTPQQVPHLLESSVPFTSEKNGWPSQVFESHLAEHIERSWVEAVEEAASRVLKVSEDDRDRFDTYLRWQDVSLTYTYNMITCIWPFASERTLFFDNDLNDLSLRIPAELRGSGRIHRWILHHLSKKLLLLPDTNTFLPPFLPSGAVSMARKVRPLLGRIRRAAYRRRNSQKLVLKTSGSWLLFHELYRRDRAYRALIQGVLADSSLFPPQVFNRKEMGRIWQQYLAGDINLHREIEALLSFALLQRQIPTRGIHL